MLQQETWLSHSGKRGRRATLVPPPPVVSGLTFVSFCKLDLEDLLVVFLFDLRGRICNLGFSSVPEFSTAS